VGKSEYANKAVDSTWLAIENDPTSDYLNAGLAELYGARAASWRVLEAQDILADGNNLEAHRSLTHLFAVAGRHAEWNAVGRNPGWRLSSIRTSFVLILAAWKTTCCWAGCTG
jgi:hypothetical protein